MHEPERERDDPPPLDFRADNVLERHVHDRQRDEHLDERREPEGIGCETARRRDERDGVRDGERRDDRDQRAQPPKRDHQAEHEQQVIEPVEYVLEAERDEAQRRLVPPRVEPHEPGVSQVLEHSLRPVRRHEMKHRRGSNPEMGERRPNREPRRRRRDRILDHDVQHRLFPRQVYGIRERRTEHARQGGVVRPKRSVGRQRESRRAHQATLQRPIVLEDLDVIGDPHSTRILELRVHAREIEVARPAEYELEIADRLQGNPNNEAQPSRFRLHVRQDHDRRRDLVRERTRRKRDRQHAHDGEDAPRTLPPARPDRSSHADEYTSTNRSRARDWTSGTRPR